MKSLIIVLIVLSSVGCSKSSSDYNSDYVNYLYDSLGISYKENRKDFFLILNPNSKCFGCYKKGYETIKNIQQQENSFIITDQLVSRSIEAKNDKNVIIDSTKRFFLLNPHERYTNLFFTVYNKKIIEKVEISGLNTDTIYTFY
jgi:hypothetical protein